MNINHADVAINYLYTKYLAAKANNFYSKSPKQIVEEPFLRNFYAGIKPSSFDYLYPNQNESNDSIYRYNFNLNHNRFKGYRRPIQYNKRLCPWNERKLRKFKNLQRKQSNKNKIRKYKTNLPDSLLFRQKIDDYELLPHRNNANKNLHTKDQDIYNIIDQPKFNNYIEVDNSLSHSDSSDQEIDSYEDSKYELDYYHICLAKYFFCWLSAFYQRIENRKLVEENNRKNALKSISTMTNYNKLDGKIDLVTLKPIKLNRIIIDEDNLYDGYNSIQSEFFQNYEIYDQYEYDYNDGFEPSES